MKPVALERFTSLADADDAQLAALLENAAELRAHPLRSDLAGRVLGLVFLNPSVRTLASFQAGMAQLGGSSFVITPGQGSWGLEWRDGVVMDGAAAEHLREAIPVLESYCDALGVRCFAEGRTLDVDLSEPILGTVARLCRGPLINLESAQDHPCQALADWCTLDDLEVPRRGGRLVLSWAAHPRALPLAVPAAVARMAARRGMDLTVLAPPGFELPRALVDEVRAEADRRGGCVRESSDPVEAMAGAHILYAKSWQAPSAYGDAERETALRQAAAARWTVRESWFENAAPQAKFLHCLPVRRNVVVEDAVLDGPRSSVLLQAANRLHAQKAILLALLGGSPAPAREAGVGRFATELRKEPS